MAWAWTIVGSRAFGRLSRVVSPSPLLPVLFVTSTAIRQLNRRLQPLCLFADGGLLLLHKDNIMKMSQSDLGSIEKEIQCLDCTRIASKVKSLSAAFSDCGVELNTPCGSTGNRTTCWIAWHLPDLNKVLCTVSVQVVEHTPGAFTMNCVSSDDTDYDSFYLESAILVYWLLRCHRCIKRLELAGTVVFLTNFPMLFCKALRVNKGLEQVLIDTTQMWDVWHGMHVSSVLASTLATRPCKKWPALLGEVQWIAWSHATACQRELHRSYYVQ
ncbi:hypothetical protein V5799_021890 [Amblyomma americanum]|uniref:Uncharacterized protein n=1 Tax=Amblyomma americanum TaxID=6943 RepID=A0AAQ4FM29_AMBAM